jgi:HSP20 family protein
MSAVTQPVNNTENSISDWAGSPLSTMHRLAERLRPIPVEEYQDGSSYVIRFELPDVNPATDLAVSARAQRTDNAPQGNQSEFRYGQYAQHVALPPGLDVRDISATYRRGILSVRIGMKP